MAFCPWVWRLDPCKHCGSRNVELRYLGSKNRLDGTPDTSPITRCRDCGKWSDEPVERNFERPKDKMSEFMEAVINIGKKMSENEKPEKSGIIHKAKCCVNCAYHSDATYYSGQCAKHSNVIVQNSQVCDYFVDRGKIDKLPE